MLSGPQVVEVYKGLWHVEQGFRQLKSELKLGPLYHYTDDRIKAHVIKKSSYSGCMDDLKALHVIEMKVENEDLHLLTEIKKGTKKLFKATKLSFPDRIVYQSPSLPKYVVPTLPTKKA